MILAIVLFGFMWAVASGICATMIASAKGRPAAAGYFFFGLFFGPLAILLAIGMPPRAPQVMPMMPYYPAPQPR